MPPLWVRGGSVIITQGPCILAAVLIVAEKHIWAWILMTVSLWLLRMNAHRLCHIMWLSPEFPQLPAGSLQLHHKGFRLQQNRWTNFQPKFITDHPDFPFQVSKHSQKCHQVMELLLSVEHSLNLNAIWLSAHHDWFWEAVEREEERLKSGRGLVRARCH